MNEKKNWSTIPLPVLAAYLVLAILPSLAMLLHPSSSPLFYPRGDLAQTLWNFWWFDQSFWHGANPYHTDMLFHPFGAYLFLHTFEAVDAFVTTPFRWIAGVEFAWKAAFVLHYFWTGVAVHLLARRLGVGNYGAAMCAIILMTSSYRTVNAGALSLMATGHAFFLAWAVVGCWQEPRRMTRGFWLALAFLLLLFSNLYYLFFMTIFLSLVMIALVIAKRPAKEAVRGWAIQLGIALLIVAGPVIFMLSGIAKAQEHLSATAGFEEWNQVRGSADLGQLLLPRWLRPIIEGKEIPEEPWMLFTAPLRAMSFFPPVAFIVIALLGMGKRGRVFAGNAHPRIVRIGLLTVLVAAFFIALGPRVKVWTTFDPAERPLEENTGEPPHWEGLSVPSPYRWLAPLPVFRQIRGNHRAGYFFLAAVVLLCAPAFERGLRRTGELIKTTPAQQALLLGAIAMLSWTENGMYFYPSEPPFPNEGLRVIAQQTGPGAVRTYPDRGYMVQGLAMYDQTVHERPIIGGYLSRDLPKYDRWLETRPWEQLLHDLIGTDLLPLSSLKRDEVLAAAEEDDFRFLVLYPLIFPRGEGERFIRYLEQNRLARVLHAHRDLVVMELERP
jgi:hypothetical protein